MSRPRLLDLFCGAGGAAMGYHRAGFEVVGVDIAPQPHYPFEFRQGDAMEWPLDGFDAVHASPPCQGFMGGRMSFNPYHRAKVHIDLLTPMRERLQSQSAPWIIENVPGAPMRVDLVLCGSMFALPRLRRHRWFEVSFSIDRLAPPCRHEPNTLTICGKVRGNSSRWGKGNTADWRAAMGMDWANEREMSQAIPPAYTEWIGGVLIRLISA
jgi:DNA (cytosine-5)-methyltransferase 1